jgi:prolyl oligopeptidase
MRPVLLSLAVSLMATTALAQSTPPHMPRDLSPAGVRAADEHLALEEVNGTEAMAFVASENEKSLRP